MLKKFIKILAQIHLILGIIGSFLIAKSGGEIVISPYYGYSKRDWWITITIFTVSIYFVLILFAILYALYKLLDNQDKNITGNDKNVLNTGNGINAEKESKLSSVDSLNRELTEGKWRCSECGKINNDFVETCGCGSSRQE